MDQSRSENNTSQQQNVHLHMHHVCNCQSNVYPAYYPAVGYRTPVPSVVTYPPQAMPRPYLQHYQYAQYNMGGQYSLPISAVATSNHAYGQSAGTDFVLPSTLGKDRRERGGSQEEGSDGVERVNENSGYDYGQITPPASELLLTENSESASPENFVKFLERSCLTAEQIAYRNRNRPCFRNIQNLCIRTRSEILKPCTTISNIHSQGIPWATKDFIYAFVRLTNCWHILKGYWENRDGSSLGKIEKELTPEFRACYVRWEKETIELAGQLTRVFYNLDTNLVSPQPQVNILKAPAPENPIKKIPVENMSTTTLTNMSLNNASKNIRGILHLPAVPITETADQANQTYSGDFCVAKEEGFDSEEERRVYMKPGSYNVPKKDTNDGASNTSPRAIEFLETAQNINKAQTGNERYWTNMNVSSNKKSSENKLLHDVSSESELELNLSSHLNVHDWLVSSNFSDFGEPSPVSTTAAAEMRPFFVDASMLYESLAPLEPEVTTAKQAQTTPSVRVLQRVKGDAKSDKVASNANGIDASSRHFRNTAKNSKAEFDGLLEALLVELKKYDILEGLDAADKNFYSPLMDIDTIIGKLKNSDYIYVNEVIRDLKYLISYYTMFAEHFTNVDNKKKELVIFITEMFSLKLRDFLLEHFPGCDFGDMEDVHLGPAKVNTEI